MKNVSNTKLFRMFMSHFPFHYAKQILLKIIQMLKQFWGEIEQMLKPQSEPAHICQPKIIQYRGEKK